MLLVLPLPIELAELFRKASSLTDAAVERSDFDHLVGLFADYQASVTIKRSASGVLII